MSEKAFIGFMLGVGFLGYSIGIFEQNIKWVRHLRSLGYPVNWRPWG